MSPNCLQFDSITKRFPGVTALSDVTFGVAKGSVHALLGENGAGKSTLLRVLSGVQPADSGMILIDGLKQTFHSAAEAIDHGIAVIYQELQLVPQLSIAENLYLGHLPNRAGWIDRPALREKALRMLALLGESIDPEMRLSKLPIGQRQMVEIAKALARDARIIAFDEPTSSLSSRETDRLFAVIRQLKSAGKVVIYVTHRMDEIFQLCDAATVLRDGRHVETFATLNGVDPDTLVQRMVGRQISDVFRYRPRKPGQALLSVQNVSGTSLCEPASFDVRAGEIVGFFGLIGSGRTELMKVIYGATRRSGGTVSIAGKPIPGVPARAIDAGLVYLPEDRKAEGIIPMRSVQENVNLSARRHFSFGRFFLSDARERGNAQRMVDRLSVRTSSLRRAVRDLSGGNQQKVILGRWLSEQPKVILLDEPTRGIDVGAKSEIYSLIYELAERGFGVVMISSELPEVLGVCDRICVMREGRIVGSVGRAEATQETLMRMALPAAVENREGSRRAAV